MPKKTFIALLLVFILPLLIGIGYFQYTLKYGSATNNYGELISPMKLISELPQSVQGHWTYVVIAPQHCATPSCRQRLRNAATVRLLTNEEMKRVRTLFISPYKLKAEDKPTNFNASITELGDPQSSYKEIVKQIIPTLEEQQLQNNIYLIDPIGNLMMTYPPNKQDTKKMLKDIKRLLKYSRLG